jgi:hypothetical protein
VATGLTAEEIAQHGGLPADVRVFTKPIHFPALREVARVVHDRHAALVQATRPRG